MRILHTSDWHLGQKFIGQSREEEQARFLDWLLETIKEKKPDVLLIAGDIFDVHIPPASAEEQYYRFLAGLLKTECKQVVITGGNHDSAIRLEAPSSILKFLNVHIIANATEDAADVLVEIHNEQGNLMATVVAVPFLQERNLGKAKAGETINDRIRRIQSGIKDYYHAAAEALTKDQKKQPVLAMGHLFATGASASEEQNNIYVGNLSNISSADFPKEFDYIALGHIHRPQTIGKQNHIRYCGAPLPLSFSEIGDEKQVLLVDFSGKKIAQIEALKVPTFRHVVRFRGSLEEVQKALQGIALKTNDLHTWAEIIIDSKSQLAALDQQIRNLVEGLPIEILKWRNEYEGRTLNDFQEAVSLSELQPKDVFEQKLEGLELEKATKQELRLQFEELLAQALNQEE